MSSSSKGHPISGLETGCPTRPNGPVEPSPGLRPEADALGEKGNQTTRPERPQEVLGRSRLAPPRFSRPFRPQGCGACRPRASACGLSPGLGSAGPLGRGGADSSRPAMEPCPRATRGGLGGKREDPSVLPGGSSSRPNGSLAGTGELSVPPGGPLVPPGG